MTSAAMTIEPAPAYRAGEYHGFEGADRPFVYLTRSGAVFEIDHAAGRLLDQLRQRPMAHGEMVQALIDSGVPEDAADELIGEMAYTQLITSGATPPMVVEEAPADMPLHALVMNITNQCNLACTYCYEFGDDKIATPEGKKKYMDLETARSSVDFLLSNSGARQAVHITFFGGETLMNFKLLKEVVTYATARGEETGRSVGYSLTTNATLLTPEIIDFLSEHAIGVTVSMDGPAELQDKRRRYKNGRGSYEVMEPRLRALIANHRTRAITARVTLTEGVTDVIRIFRHLKDDLGFHEVGFAPVTTSGSRDFSLSDEDMANVVRQFHQLADEWLEYALRGQMHGFSNVSETIAELIQGVNKSHPCGAGLGLLGVGPGGDLAPCHRFADADSHSLGHISTGIDQDKRRDFLSRGHVGAKYDCHSCWARPLCAGGCHHEAFVRYGDTGHANLHYCDWIREWTDTCLRIYGAVSALNPQFLERFAARKALS